MSSAAVRQAVTVLRDGALPVLEVFRDHMAGHGWSDLTLDNTHTRDTLGGASGDPRITPCLLTTYLNHHIHTGYLPAPPA